MHDPPSIRDVVLRLSRPHPSGGRVIERAAMMAAGSDAKAILSWVAAHGVAEELAPRGGGQGIHGIRSRSGIEDSDPRQPLRYVIPADALVVTDD